MDMVVEGRHALLFDDDTTAAFVNSVEALVPWNNDASLLIDRYDVRHLLDRIPPRPAPDARLQRLLIDAGDGASLAELDRERFQDLSPSGDEEGEHLDSEAREKSEAKGSGAYQAVPFSYGEKNEMSSHDNAEISSCFRPSFEVPEFLLNHLVSVTYIVINSSGVLYCQITMMMLFVDSYLYLPVRKAIIVQDAWSRDEVLLRLPFIGTCFLVMCLDVRSRQPPTEKLHQIMARTAIFVSDHGGQSEIVLRVKQGSNPTFGFLMPDHNLHAYFRYLVDHTQILKLRTDSTKIEEEKTGNLASEVGALSLLGSAYGAGEDDDSNLRIEAKETEPLNLTVGSETVPRTSEIILPPAVSLENKEVIKRPFSTGAKENPLPIKKSFSRNATTTAASKKTGVEDRSCTTEKAPSSQKSISDHKPLILEPPSFLKRTIDKIVEFIVRNGKQFEAILIEQDKNIGRFPFLLPTNQYNSYYLKILEEALELKLHGKNLFDLKNDAERHGGCKKKDENQCKDSSVDNSDLAELAEGGYYDPKRKDKFKMVLGGQKKDSEDQHSKASKQSGLSADEVAAIVLAATKGVSPANAHHRKLSEDGGQSKNSGATAEEAAAIVMAATRGRSPANAPPRMLRDVGQTSSFGSLQTSKLISKPTSNGMSGTSVPTGLSGSTVRSDKKNSHSTSDVSVATIIAKTVALAASREADSSEAGLTKDEKLKAERLKRAKMFAALIKSGDHCVSELVNSVNNLNGSVEPSAGGSLHLGTDPEAAGKEREGSSVPFDAEGSDREHESSKKHHSRSKVHEDDSDENYKYTRKKHHSLRSKDDHTHRKRHSSSKDKERRHHYKHDSSSDDEYKLKRNSWHRYRTHDPSSEDVDRQRCEKRHRKHHSHVETKRETKVGDKWEHSEEPSTSLVGLSDRREIAALDDKQPSYSSEIPCDLRAKIRAMLMETL